MADTLNLYKGEELVKSEEYVDGKASVTVDGLDANTDYPEGTYQVSRKNENGESEKVDVPAFKTKPIAVTGVTLAKENLTLEPGDKGSTNASIQPSTATNKGLKFSSSNEDVATVDGKGEITAVAEGNANITVTTVDGNKTATLKLTVKAATVNVTGVTVEPKTLSLDVGETQKLNGKIVPNNATNKSSSWSSDNEDVATIANSTVTAVSPGNAVITLTSADGGHTDTCEVTVVNPTINVTGIDIEPKTATLEIGDTQQLTPTVTPANASDKTVTYASKAQGVAGVDDKGLITAKTAGTAEIVATTKDGNKNATCTVTINAPSEPEPEPEPDETE